MYDIVIIGAGICGSVLAHDLSKYDVKVGVIDRQGDVANEVSMANSAIVHAGYDPEEGSLKAKLNIMGAKRYPALCEEIEADYQRCGAFVMASGKMQEESLSVLYERCCQRDIKAKLIDGDELRTYEPHVKATITQALTVPDTAIIYPWQVAINCMEEAMLNGVKLFLREEVTSIVKQENGYRIASAHQHWDAHYVINAAGCGAEQIAQMIGPSPFTITPKKGEYYVLSKLASEYVKHILYPVPTALGKGVLVLPTTHGNILLGPNAQVCEQGDLATSQTGLAYVKQHVNEMMDDVPYQEIIRSYSGLRPSGNHGDFYIGPAKEDDHFLHIACIDSPGLASAPGIAQYVIETYLSKHFKLCKKEQYQKRRPSIRCADMKQEDVHRLIQQEPSFGQLLCRCEQVSKGEILDVINRPCGATSIKGVKKRIRAGMGKCQGGFCEVEVAKVLAEALQIPLSDVLYDQEISTLGEVSK